MVADDSDKAPETSSSELPDDDDPKGLAGVPSAIAETIIALVTHVPPQVQRSMFKVIDHLFMAGVSWPAAYLRGKAAKTQARTKVDLAKLEAEASEVRAIQKAREVFIKDSARAAISRFSDPEKAERAFNYHASTFLRDHDINEEIVLIAAEEVQKDPPKEDSTAEIDSDWLTAFFKEAPTRSSDEYKLLFGRILAGEIKKPGTFSISTIRSLSALTSETAQIFQRLCNISTLLYDDAKIIADPFGNAGDNSLRSLGLDYGNLVKLVESGLIRPTFTEWQEINYFVFEYSIPVIHADVKIVIKPDSSGSAQLSRKNLRVTGPAFTAVGAELRRVVTMKHSPEYLRALAGWFKGHALDLYVVTHEDAGRVRGEKIEPL